MAGGDFNMVFVLFAVCVCTQWDLVSPQTNWAMYYKETQNADFGVRMRYEQSEGPKMSVIISYDTETQSVKDFFQTQITAKMIDEFDSCNNIAWHFDPCTTSKFDSGALVCGNGLTQCFLDQVHSCVTKALEGDQSKMGKFLICRFTLHKSTAQCGLESGLKEDDIKKCVNNGDGAKACNDFHIKFENARTKRTQAEMDSATKDPSAITDFRNSVCTVLAQGNLKCPAACGSG